MTYPYLLEFGAGGGIRTHEPIRDRILSPAPLTTSATPATPAKSIKDLN